MATIKEQEELVEVLKFTPRTYRIELGAYGGEVYAGRVDRATYEYFKENNIDIEVQRYAPLLAREVLRRYQDFLTWGKGYLSLVDNLIYDDTPTTENERQEMRAMQMMAQDIYSPYPKRWTMEDSSKVKNQQRRAFLDRIDGTHNADTDLRYENYLYAMKIIGVAMGVMQHRDNKWARMVVSMSKVREFLIALHAPEIIDAVALPAGQTAPRSKWAAWMNGWVKDAYPTNG